MKCAVPLPFTLMIVLVYSHPHVSDGCLLMFRFCRLRLRDVDTPPVVDLIVCRYFIPVCVLYRIPTLLFLHVLLFDQMCARTIRISEIQQTEPVVITKHLV